MEAVWLAIIVGMLPVAALSALICRTEAAQRIAERIGFSDTPEWAKK